MGREDTERLSGSEDKTTAEDPDARARRSRWDSGQYQLGNQLGRGGMGEVLSAHDAVIGREVAIKRLHEARPTAELEARFLREAQIQGRLDHPSIPPVYELGRDGHGRPYIVMKRLAGTTLAEILSGVEAGRIPYARERLLRAFIDVCLAVELAHTRGVIHRDLKPSNIMLGEFGEVYVLDWGVAKVIGDASGDPITHSPVSSAQSTRDGIAVGTPLYMSPEQQESRQDLDGRADVFALGRVLCEILAGKRLRRPIESEEERRPSFHSPPREIAPELDELCFAATAPARRERIASARELADRVQSYLDGDRDVALRRKLAAEHLERALALYETGSQNYPIAIREAGRALALDPTLAPAADLVGRLMLETPNELPPEVEYSLADAEVQQIQRTARVGILAYLAYLVFVPALFAIGMREPVYLLALVITVAVLWAAAWFGVSQPLARWRVPVLLAGNAIVVALFARMFTPFMIAPGIAAVTALVLFRSPAFRGKWTIPTVVILLLGVAGPWTGEQLGWIASTHTYMDGGVFLRSPAIQMPKLGIGLGLVFYTACIISVAALISTVHARSQRVAEKQLHLHAWWLRQLVPAQARREPRPVTEVLP